MVEGLLMLLIISKNIRKMIKQGKSTLKRLDLYKRSGTHHSRDSAGLEFDLAHLGALVNQRLHDFQNGHLR